MSKKTTIEEEEKVEEIEGFEELPEFGDAVPESEEEPEEPEEPGEPEEAEPEAEPETPMFKFVEPEPQEKPFMTVIHRGKEVPIATEEEAKNFIQKGYDYDIKVGTHGKFARTLDEHPAFAQRVAQVWEDYASGRQSAPAPAAKPTLKSIDEYENPNDWLMDNYQALKSAEAASAPQVQMPQRSQVNPLEMALAGRDPENYYTVAPHIKSYAEKYLTKAQYEKIDNDLPSLIQFYDQVKALVVKPKQTKEATPDPPFRVKSGGGEPPTPSSKAPWEGNNAQFEDYMNRVKGISSY